MRKTKSVNIRTLAALAGVSPATASRALNGSTAVDAETRKRILRLAKETGYPLKVPEARKTIAVIVPGIGNTYYSHTVTGILEVAEQAGYSVSLHLSDSDPEKELRCLEAAAAENACGLILAPVTDRDPRTLCAFPEGFPIVVTGPRHIAEGLIHVHLDFEEAAYLSTRYLLRLGRRRIALIVYYWANKLRDYGTFLAEYETSDPGKYTAHDSYAGYCRALREFGLEPDPSLITFGGFSYDSGYAAARELLGKGVDFDAFITPNDRCGAGVLNSLTEQGIGVPAQVSLVCLDCDLIAKVISPKLTSIASPDRKIGRCCAEQLLKALTGAPADDVTISASLTIESSTQFIPKES
ncbi:MAG: LacI family DNA-binding transcriptional regulator [Clostridia bacterium]|nr:LacI family DNA-binding transcriptional regulator [Clostridia bacterium]